MTKTKLTLIFIIITSAILTLISLRGCKIIKAEICTDTNNGITVDIMPITKIYDSNGDQITYITVNSSIVNSNKNTETLKFNTQTEEIGSIKTEKIYISVILVSFIIYLIVGRVDSKSYNHKIKIYT